MLTINLHSFFYVIYLKKLTICTLDQQPNLQYCSIECYVTRSVTLLTHTRFHISSLNMASDCTASALLIRNWAALSFTLSEWKRERDGEKDWEVVGGSKHSSICAVQITRKYVQWHYAAKVCYSPWITSPLWSLWCGGTDQRWYLVCQKQSRRQESATAMLPRATQHNLSSIFMLHCL